MSGEIKYGYVDRPNYELDYLLDSVGYVRKIWVEQEDARDQLLFKLDIYRTAADPEWVREQVFCVYLDRNATVAFAQLQLLREALYSMGTKVCHLVRVHYTFADETLEAGYAYSIQLLEGRPFPTGMQEFYGTTSTLWFTHVDS